MSDAKNEVKQRIDSIESSYEFFLAYAAQGRTTDEGAKSGAELREFLTKLEDALEGDLRQLMGDRTGEVRVVGAPQREEVPRRLEQPGNLRVRLAHLLQ